MRINISNSGETKTYYHVTDRPWDGNDLLPYNQCSEDCIELDDYERGVDPDYVCLYESLADAQDHLRYVCPTGTLLAITADIDGDGITINGKSITTVAEGYPAIAGSIPSRRVSVIE